MATRKKASPRHPDEPDDLRVDEDALFEARKKAAKNQMQVAVDGKVSLRLISQLEGGVPVDPTLRTVGRIAKALGVRDADLLTRKPRPKVRKKRY